MATFMLVLVLMTDGGTHEWVLDHGLTAEDCIEAAMKRRDTICVQENQQ